MIRSRLLGSLTGLRHALTDRAFGSIGPRDDPRALGRRAEAVRTLDAEPDRLVTPHQVHGRVVRRVRPDDAGKTLPGTDGLVTTAVGLPLMVQGADCPLVLLAAPGACAAVHSGWRGTVARICERAVDALSDTGVAPRSLHAAIFPGIGPCCFEVGPEVVARFQEVFGERAAAWSVPSGRAGHALLDLPAAIVTTLTEAGVPRGRVDVVPGCTACGGLLWSHRASGGAPERHGLFVVLGASNPAH